MFSSHKSSTNNNSTSGGGGSGNNSFMSFASTLHSLAPSSGTNDGDDNDANGDYSMDQDEIDAMSRRFLAGLEDYDNNAFSMDGINFDFLANR